MPGPTIKHAIEHEAQIVLMTHLGRSGGGVDTSLSLRPVAERLQALLDGHPVRLIDDWPARSGTN